MDEKRKEYLVTALCVLGVVVSMAVGWFSGYAYRDYKAAAERNTILRTVQQLKSAVRSLDAELRTAREELARGQSANTEAQGTAEDLARRNEQSQQLLDDSRERLADIERQFTEIDRANGIAGTDK